MERKLHLLESFTAHGSDGREYHVHGYEHLARLEAVPDAQAQWEPTGLAEYRLDDGRLVTVAPDGTMRIEGGVTLRY